MASPKEPATPAISALLPSREPGSIVLVIGGRIGRADIPALCEHVRRSLEGSDARRAVCDVGALVDPDVATVDALARLQLTARRLGREVRLSRARDDLRKLLDYMGLTDVIPLCGELSVEPRGQPEQREEGGGIEEEAGPDDLTG